MPRARWDALTLCDATQAVGWLPVAASEFDGVICHAYKWLCAPRGVSFLAVSERLAKSMTPLFAGWYAGQDPWTSCYGSDVTLASDARRFDVSPAWQAFVGAEPALDLFASLPPLSCTITRSASRTPSGSGWTCRRPNVRARS